MKIVTVIGARPQFVKAAAVSKSFLGSGIEETIVHTGQHYDKNMSSQFFDELGIPEPAINLNVRATNQGDQTAQMLLGIENVLLESQFDGVLVYGDTNSTVAASLAASKLHTPVFHVEAGLRSFNKRMPEEINRIMTDHVSDLLFCPTETAVSNLSLEGIHKGVFLTGDVMQETLLSCVDGERDLGLPIHIRPDDYYVATVHRAENTNSIERLSSIFLALSSLDKPVVLPLHPRTRKFLETYNIHYDCRKITIIEPVGYQDMVNLVARSLLVLTDSGGLQKEAVWLSKPCVTLRDETEWVETLELNRNILVGANTDSIIEGVSIASDAKKYYADSTLPSPVPSEYITELILKQSK